jgi:hypothetical protein
MWLTARVDGGAPAAPLAPTRNATTGRATAEMLVAMRFGTESMITSACAGCRSPYAS